MDTFSVLVVDDEEDFVDTLVKRLTRRGLDCIGVYSGRKGIEICSKRDFDVVLLDMILDDMKGNEVLRELKKMNPETQVVILSGHASARAGREGLAEGASDYLLKPVEFESLFEKLRSASGRRIELV